MKYQNLFIDFDDTLYDTYGNAVIALRETFEAFRLDRFFPDPQVFYDAYWAANIDLWKRYSQGEITRDYLIIERFRRPLLASENLMTQEPSLIEEESILKISDRFLDFCSTKPGLLDGARELMEYLKGKGYRTHMTSNGFHEVQYKKLAACGLSDLFDTIILSEDAGANKPSAQYFDYALHVAGAERATTLMIGDNLQSDILGALASGIDAMLYNRWNVDTAGCTPAPTFVVNSLREIQDIL